MSGNRERPSDGVLRDLIAALTEEDAGSLTLDGARVDAGRAARKGVPEVIYASNKSPEHVIEVARVMLSRSGRAIISRAQDGLLERLRVEFPSAEIEYRLGMWTVVARVPGCCPPWTGGRIGVSRPERRTCRWWTWRG